MNMHSLPLEGNFCDDHVKAMKLAIIQDCDGHMGYVDESDLMTNYYSVSRWTWKWTKKLFFQLMDLNHFQQRYHFYLLYFKIITLTVRTDIGHGLNTRGGKGASTADRKMKKTSPINKPNTVT
jgi:hypothetical protein